jgi:hypothetical protein
MEGGGIAPSLAVFDTTRRPGLFALEERVPLPVY